MEGKRFIQKLRLKNLLSYGNEGVEIELEPLNVLIGPSGSGKSNLIDALRILRAAPTDLAVPFREGSGVQEWLYKEEEGFPIAEIEKEKAKRWLEDLNPNQSIISQRKDAKPYGIFTYLNDSFASIHVYTDWDVTRHSALRKPQMIDDRTDFLAEDASNLAIILRDLERRGCKPLLLEHLQKFYEEVEDLTIQEFGDYGYIGFHL
jgi:predicted ATPase